jgi:hypothetical protein
MKIKIDYTFEFNDSDSTLDLYGILDVNTDLLPEVICTYLAIAISNMAISLSSMANGDVIEL